MNVRGICDFCAKEEDLVFGWWAVGINLCFPCNKEREKVALSRVLAPEKELKP